MDTLPNRKPTRLPGYDYSQANCYFVTICTAGKKNILGDIRRGDPCGRPEWIPTALGIIAEKNIACTEEKFGIAISPYVIMPNHIHLMISLLGQRATARVAPTLSQIIGAYKSKVSYDYLQLCKKNNTQMGTLWQRSYYDHVIRNEADYLRIWQYIDENPAKWTEDEYYM